MVTQARERTTSRSKNINNQRRHPCLENWRRSLPLTYLVVVRGYALFGLLEFVRLDVAVVLQATEDIRSGIILDHTFGKSRFIPSDRSSKDFICFSPPLSVEFFFPHPPPFFSPPSLCPLSFCRSRVGGGGYYVQGRTALYRDNWFCPVTGSTSATTDWWLDVTLPSVSRLVYFLLSQRPRNRWLCSDSGPRRLEKRRTTPLWFGRSDCMNSCYQHDPEEGCNLCALFDRNTNKSFPHTLRLNGFYLTLSSCETLW